MVPLLNVPWQKLQVPVDVRLAICLPFLAPGTVASESGQDNAGRALRGQRGTPPLDSPRDQRDREQRSKPWAHYDAKPNAGHQARLEAVACLPLLGSDSGQQASEDELI